MYSKNTRQKGGHDHRERVAMNEPLTRSPVTGNAVRRRVPRPGNFVPNRGTGTRRDGDPYARGSRPRRPRHGDSERDRDARGTRPHRSRHDDPEPAGRKAKRLSSPRLPARLHRGKRGKPKHPRSAAYSINQHREGFEIY
jgi:hypothetical protein